MPKFRCFDKDTKTMHEVVSIDFRDWRVYYEAYGLRNYWNKNVVLMQSTGLHDNTNFKDLSEEEQEEWLESGKTSDEWQGREVFEGDIVNVDRTFRNPMTGSGTLTLNKNFEVIFVNGMFTREGSSMGIEKDFKYLTVIGNVHQHAELLEGGIK